MPDTYRIFGGKKLTGGNAGFRQSPKENQADLQGAKEVLENILSENEGRYVILKIDTEGSEFPIFDSIKNTDILSRIDCIVMEYHRNPAELVDILKHSGYRYHIMGQAPIGYICAFKGDGN